MAAQLETVPDLPPPGAVEITGDEVWALACKLAPTPGERYAVNRRLAAKLREACWRYHIDADAWRPEETPLG